MMRYGTIPEKKIGGKARGLLKLVSLLDGTFQVPKFVIIPGERLKYLLENETKYLKWKRHLKRTGFKCVSVRSSPEISMPGIMETKLNVELDQVYNMLKVVHDSYYTPLAVRYRKRNQIIDEPPSVVIQEMVHGTGKNSGAGVAFSRNVHGEFSLIYEYAENCYGTDIVDNLKDISTFQILPDDIYEPLEKLMFKLEREFKHPVDVEFTVDNGVLYILQVREFVLNDIFAMTRAQKDLLKKGIIDEDEYTRRMTPRIEEFKEVVQINCEVADEYTLYRGVGVVPGVVVSTGDNVYITDRIDNTKLDEIYKYDGVITTSGGATSHISIICRNINKPYAIINDTSILNLVGAEFILDGATGTIFRNVPGVLKTITSKEIYRYVFDQWTD